EHDVELGHPEGRGDLVLDDLDLVPPTSDIGALLDALGAADLQPDGGVELQRPSAGGGLRIAVHDTDLHPQLIDEDNDTARAVDGAGQLAEGLRHQARLEADMA